MSGDTDQFVTKSTYDNGFDVEASLADQRWYEQRGFQQQPQQPQQLKDDMLVSVGFHDASINNLVEIIGEESGRNEKRLRSDIKDWIRDATEPLIKVNAELRAELETVKSMISLRAEITAMRDELQTLKNANVTPIRGRSDAKAS